MELVNEKSKITTCILLFYTYDINISVEVHITVSSQA